MGVERTYPGTVCSVPGKGGDPREGRSFQHFLSRFPTWNYFRVPCFGFSIIWKPLFRGCNIIIPHVDVFCIPRYFNSPVQRPTLRPQVTSSNADFLGCFSFLHGFEYDSKKQTLFSPPGEVLLCPLFSRCLVQQWVRPRSFLHLIYSYNRRAVSLIRTCIMRTTAER